MRTFIARFRPPAALVVAAILTFLQRAPLLPALARLVPPPALLSSANVLRAACTAAPLGVPHALAGATEYVQSPANPVRGSVGSTLSVAFTYSGTPTPPLSFRVEGALPPGLAFAPPGPVNGIVNVGVATVTGTPTAAGEFVLRVQAYNGRDAIGHTNGIWHDIRFVVEASAVVSSPVITTQPLGRSVNAGSTVTFVADATGSPSPTYQWLKNGVPIPGATRSSLTLVEVTAADAGSFTVVATNSVGTATSAPAVLAVNAVAVGVAPVITSQLRELTANPGNLTVLTVLATGEPAPTYQWRRNFVALPGETGPQLVLPAVSPADAGTYEVRVSNAAGSLTSATAILTVNSAPASRLSGLAVRSRLAAGQTLIVGFSTSAEKPLLVRAVGPSLAGFGLGADLSENPRIALHDSAGTFVAQNDNWDSGLAETFARLGAFPLPPGSADAALVRPVTGGGSALVTGTTPGLVLVEVYDAGGERSRLASLSARSFVGSGNDVLIAGFVIAGPTARTLLIRGIGPALAAFGVSGALSAARLEIITELGQVVARSDTSPAVLAPIAARTGAFPLTPDSRDAAVIVTLPPGLYSAKVSGLAGGTGEGLVEIYELP